MGKEQCVCALKRQGKGREEKGKRLVDAGAGTGGRGGHVTQLEVSGTCNLAVLSRQVLPSRLSVCIVIRLARVSHNQSGVVNLTSFPKKAGRDPVAAPSAAIGTCPLSSGHRLSLVSYCT